VAQQMAAMNPRERPEEVNEAYPVMQEKATDPVALIVIMRTGALHNQ
jgi:hypothetical protein